MNTVAIVIARGGSTRLPNKNLLKFNGRTLIGHKVWQLRQCGLIDRIVVGSDSDEILASAQDEGAKIIRREPEYCDEKSRSWNEVIHDMVSKVEGETIVWAHCTNPCIKPETYAKALEAYGESENDSLVSVTQFRNHIWWDGNPLNFDPKAKEHTVAAKLRPVYFQNGGIFIAHRLLMLEKKYVYGDDPLLFDIEAGEATDVDTWEDLDRAAAYYFKR